MPLYLVSEGTVDPITSDSLDALCRRLDLTRGGLDWLVASTPDEASALAWAKAWDAKEETNFDAKIRHGNHLVDLTTEVSEAERGLVEQILAAVENQ